MTTLSPARRVPGFDDLELAGDYTDPHSVMYGEEERQAIYFLLPVHTGVDRYDHSGHQGNGVHMVTQPPWTFRECPDKSIEIRASIGCGPQPYYWHGYLDEGNVWRQV
jgi:hypothetical protein